MSNITVGGGGGGSSGLAVGTTTVAGGTSGFALTDNAGVLGNQAIRAVRTANATYFVSTTGNDANDGLTLGTAWATNQHAYNVISSGPDFAGFTVTVQMADGSYIGSNGNIDTTGKPWVGGGQLVWNGNLADQTKVSIDGGGNARSVIHQGANIPGFFIVNNIQLANTGGDFLVFLDGAGYVDVVQCNCGAVNPGSGNSAHFYVGHSGAILEIDGNYSITAGTDAHIFAYFTGSLLWYYPGTVTAVGTINFSQAFALAQEEGNIDTSGATFSGAFTGPRFFVSTNGSIETYTNDPNYFPGNANGIVIDGGQYSGLSNHVIATPVTGGTVSMSLLHPNQILTPAGTLATLTVNLPPISALPPPYSENGAFAYISSTHTITALTIASTDGSSIVGAPSALSADAGFGMIYDTTANTWYPWIGQSSGGGGGSPGGSNGDVQYNNSGAFGGDPNFTTDGSGNVVLTTVNLLPLFSASNDSSLRSVAVGNNAGAGQSGSATNYSNVAIGGYAMGGGAGGMNTGATVNIAIGEQSMYKLIGGQFNIGVGGFTLTSNNNGNGNTSIGHTAGFSVNGGNDNLAMGYQALYHCVTGSDNLAMGVASLFSCTGDRNVAMGRAALQNLAGGGYNVAEGYSVAGSIVSGSNNTWLGARCDPGVDVSTTIGIGTGDGTIQVDYNYKNALAWTFASPIIPPHYTVAGLPTPIAGMRATVTDSTVALSGAATGSAPIGSGSHTVPVFANETPAWVIG